MSQENVEVFKRAFDAINRRDAEALLSELDPEVEWHPAILMAMGGRPRRLLMRMGPVIAHFPRGQWLAPRALPRKRWVR
jgi:ketosteroid isomerase-like protein